MLASKQPESNVKTIVHPEWKWVQPTYTFETSKPISALQSIEIDPSYRMPDINRANNKIDIPKLVFNKIAERIAVHATLNYIPFKN